MLEIGRAQFASQHHGTKKELDYPSAFGHVRYQASRTASADFPWPIVLAVLSRLRLAPVSSGFLLIIRLRFHAAPRGSRFVVYLLSTPSSPLQRHADCSAKYRNSPRRSADAKNPPRFGRGGRKLVQGSTLNYGQVVLTIAKLLT
jgi:hypothetical protein